MFSASDIAFLLPVFAAMGLGAGFLSGLLGVGGGIILVPGLYYVLTGAGVSADVAMHMAVGTSFAVIVPTGFSSARAHFTRGAVDFSLVRGLGAGVVAGVVMGALIASFISGAGLMLFFASALLLVALLMAAEPQRFFPAATMPSAPWRILVSLVVGFVSSLMGIGGASLSVPFMTMAGVPVHRAVGSEAALGLLISVPATFIYMLTGWGREGLPPFSLGYLHIAAWVMLVPFGVLAAPLGARVAHIFSVARLRRVFAFFLLIVACKMFWDVYASG